MKSNLTPRCLLDTNVIYPIDIRDILLWFAHFGLFIPKWTDDIFDEWKRLMTKKGVPVSQIKKRIQNIEVAFPEAKVFGYRSIISSLNLPDALDRHVLAAAIVSNCDSIITNNLKDFPKDVLLKFDIEPISPDAFIFNQLTIYPETSMSAIKKLVAVKKTPPRSLDETITRYKRIRLFKTAEKLRRMTT